MKNKKLKIILPIVLILFTGLFSFFFLFPDQKLKDDSELIPDIQPVPTEQNSYFKLNPENSNFSLIDNDSGMHINKMIDLLLDQNKINETDFNTISEFLKSQDNNITYLHQASKLAEYQHPAVSDLQNINSVTFIYHGTQRPISSNLLLIQSLVNYHQNDKSNAILNLMDNIILNKKLRRNSIGLIDYILIDFNLKKTNLTIDLYAKENFLSKQEQESLKQSIKDNDHKDYINALKYDYVITKNEIRGTHSLRNTNYLNYIFQNNYNFQLNKTLNLSANYYEELIEAIENNNCQPIPAENIISELPTCNSTLECLFVNNGIGNKALQAFIPIEHINPICLNDEAK